MPGSGISLGAYRPKEVDVFGQSFTTVDLTRAANRKIRDLYKELQESDDITDAAEAAKVEDANVELIGKIIDARLKPATGQPKASKLIVDKWRADEVGEDRLLLFLAEVMAVESRPQ